MRSKLYYSIRGIGVLAVVIALFAMFWCYRRLSARVNAVQAPTTAQEVAPAGHAPKATHPTVEKTSQPIPVSQEQLESPTSGVATHGLPRSPSLAKEQPESPPSAVAAGPGSTEEAVSPEAPQQNNGTNSPCLRIASIRRLVPEGGAMLTGWSFPDGSRRLIVVVPLKVGRLVALGRRLEFVHEDTEEKNEDVNVCAYLYSISPSEWTDLALPPLLEVGPKGMQTNGAVYSANQLSEFFKKYDGREIQSHGDIISPDTSMGFRCQRFSEEKNGTERLDGLGACSVTAKRDPVSGMIEIGMSAAELGGTNLLNEYPY